MNKTSQVIVEVPTDLLKEFDDKIVWACRYGSRRAAILEAMRLMIEQAKQRKQK